MHRLIGFGRCFGDPISIRILVLLMESEMTIDTMQRVMGLDRSTINFRLTKLRNAEIVTAHYQGRWLMFRLTDKAVPVVKRLLGDFYEEIEWDPEVTEDLRRAREVLSEQPIAS